jgi:hypothetical protein
LKSSIHSVKAVLICACTALSAAAAGAFAPMHASSQIFSGELHGGSRQKEFESAFFRHEMYKLLGCEAQQGRTIALATFRTYAAQLLPGRLEQLEKLRRLLAA